MSQVARETFRIFVGNLPWTVGHRELRTYFQEFGKVLTAKVIFDRKSGCSKGYGFVTLNNKAALENLEKKTKHSLEGNYLNIQKSN